VHAARFIEATLTELRSIDKVRIPVNSATRSG